ncbi:Cu/Pi carrier [Serendipita sp. 411]|nr:Cu/Pi carrier [Serendipita sp. 411]
MSSYRSPILAYFPIRAGGDVAPVAGGPPPPTGVSLFMRYALAGAVCCSVTHGALTPVDVVKTRIQLEPEVYNRGMIPAFRQVIKAEGAGALLTGFGPTAIGYALQGAFKFGGYEFWKKTAIEYFGVEKASENRQLIYLGASAIAEFFADIALCPLEATRIRLEKLVQATGKPKSELSPGVISSLNLGGGLIAGFAAAIISQPADTLLSKINKTSAKPGETVTSRLVKMAGELGPRGLFTGLGARLVMVGTLTAGQFAIYGDIKRILNATGGVEIAKVKVVA